MARPSLLVVRLDLDFDGLAAAQGPPSSAHWHEDRSAFLDRAADDAIPVSRTGAKYICRRVLDFQMEAHKKCLEEGCVF